ncbi:MAG: hypothetical protein K2X97_10830, partial [Mycobacteriaceae bacterium]|nr:hypothetical protein [Mycobacteriaceae bacterium]
MNAELDRLLSGQGGVVTSVQALTHLTRRGLEADLKCGVLEKIWYGIYGRGVITDALRLRGLDLATGTTIAVCLNTAAARYGFDTELDTYLHVLNPGGQQLRPARGLVVHRRDGAPLTVVDGRPATTPAWTAIEVARGLRRPRALATLDAALRSGTCGRDELRRVLKQHSRRRGVVAARELLELASPLAESPMESETRLVMLDGGLPPPVLQYEIVDTQGCLRRLDFAWPELRVAAEY